MSKQRTVFGESNKENYQIQVTARSNSILRLPAVKLRSGYSRTTLYKRIAERTWTKPVKLGANSIGWPDHEVNTLIAARIAGKNDAQLRELVKELELSRKKAIFYAGN